MRGRSAPTGLSGDVAVGLLVLVLSLAARAFRITDLSLGALAVLATAVLAAGISRRQPAWSLALIWVSAGLQLLAGSLVIGVEVAVLIVAYGTARRGRPATLWAAGLSIPLGAGLAIGYAALRPEAFAEAAIAAELLRASGLGITAGFFVAAAVPGAPFALGLLFRVEERNRRISVERDLAQTQAAVEHDLAEARAQQTAMARDVHDIVGHSLAVIIAQADAAGLATHDPAVRTALDRIALVGRASLADVRDVLSQTRDSTPTTVEPPTELSLDELVRGVREAGNVIDESVAGPPGELPDASAAVAYRVLQELLTNCLKHGIRGRRIDLTQAWSGDGLTLRVTNPCKDGTFAGEDGMGLTGVRARLDAIGGALQVRVDTAQDGTHYFTASAFVPSIVRVSS